MKSASCRPPTETVGRAVSFILNSDAIMPRKVLCGGFIMFRKAFDFRAAFDDFPFRQMVIAAIIIIIGVVGLALIKKHTCAVQDNPCTALILYTYGKLDTTIYNVL